jgi:glycosyltransferase involved in cell wall biosynthesis
MGGQKGIALFYQYLKEHVPVTIISVPANEIPADLKERYLPLLNPGQLRYINLFLFFSLAREIKARKFTHLVLEHPYFAWLGLLLKRFTGVQLVVHSHNIESLRFKSTNRWWWKILRAYEKKLHRKADINFFITDEDRLYAIKEFSLEAGRCHTVTYGFEMNAYPPKEEKAAAQQKIRDLHHILPAERILLFNGTLSYKPNLDAVDIILKHINPALRAQKDSHYKIIICGKGLPENYRELQAWSSEHIIYAGFVEDITLYFKAADIFINPVLDGGGIKTKLVEALGHNVNGVSTASGAIGIPAQAAGQKLIVTPDGDWAAFTHAILNTHLDADTPAAFFAHFYWGNIAAKAASILENNHSTL